jgi:hypothetical protein
MAYLCIKSGRECAYLRAIVDSNNTRPQCYCYALMLNKECPFKYNLNILSFVKRPEGEKPIIAPNRGGGDMDSKEIKEINAKLDAIFSMVQQIFVKLYGRSKEEGVDIGNENDETSEDG